MTRDIVPQNDVQGVLQWDVEFPGEQAEDRLRVGVDVDECVVGSGHGRIFKGVGCDLLPIPSLLKSFRVSPVQLYA